MKRNRLVFAGVIVLMIVSGCHKEPADVVLTPDNLPEGALSGVFSVSASTKVCFASGNLYWTPEDNTQDGYQGTCRFERQQNTYRTWNCAPAAIGGGRSGIPPRSGHA